LRQNDGTQSMEKAIKKRKIEIAHDKVCIMNGRAPKVSKLEQLISEDLDTLKRERVDPQTCFEENQETAFHVTTTATIQLASTSESLKKHVQKPIGEKYSDVYTARLLTTLKSPMKEAEFATVNTDENKIHLVRSNAHAANSGGSSKDSVPKIRHQREQPFNFAGQFSSPKPTRGCSQLTKGSLKLEKATAQYTQLRAYLKNLTQNSTALMHARNMRGPTLSLMPGVSSGLQRKHAKLLTEQQAAHECLQKRLLRSAETTLRLLLDDDISADDARADLKASIKRFEEILSDTLHRHQMETDAFWTQYHCLKNNVGMKSLSNGEYPCQSAFAKVEEICAAITRPVGRPKSTVCPPLSRDE
jgi:hypothetical protein